MKIVFHNSANLGDVFIVSQIINWIIEHNPEHDITFCSKNCSSLYMKHEYNQTAYNFGCGPIEFDGVIYIGTWMGNWVHRIGNGRDFDILSVYENIKQTLTELDEKFNITLNFPAFSIEEVIPRLPDTNIDKFFEWKRSANFSRYVFIYNYTPRSGQSVPCQDESSYTNMIINLAHLHPTNAFIVPLHNMAFEQCGNVLSCDKSFDCGRDTQDTCINIIRVEHISRRCDYAFVFDVGACHFYFNLFNLRYPSPVKRYHIGTSDQYHKKIHTYLSGRELCSFIKCSNMFEALAAINSICSHVATKGEIIRFENGGSGFFSYALGMAEWLHSLEYRDIDGLIFLDRNYYNSGSVSLSSLLFEQPRSNATFLIEQDTCRTRTTNNYPTQNSSGISPTNLSYSYLSKTYTTELFMKHRNSLAPIIQCYLKPLPHIREKIDNFTKQFVGKNVVGIHVRCYGHMIDAEKNYNTKFNTEESAYLDSIQKDIEGIMQGKNPQSTILYLATLIKPLVQWASSRYQIITQDVYRSDEWTRDWCEIKNISPLDAEKVIIDVWALSKCDEVWCGVSNMTSFVACMNPQLKINILPSLSL